jgi:hypothetical protein
MDKDIENKIPLCQQIQNEYKSNLNVLREVVAEIDHGGKIQIEDFIKCMSFVYREGWGDCFHWNGEISGEQTRNEFYEILKIDRYGRLQK